MNTKTFNVSMPNELVKKIDKQSKLQGSNRSDFIRLAVKKQLTALEQWQTISGSVRQSYKGPTFSEEEVANIVRNIRNRSK